MTRSASNARSTKPVWGRKFDQPAAQRFGVEPARLARHSGCIDAGTAGRHRIEVLAETTGADALDGVHRRGPEQPYSVAGQEEINFVPTLLGGFGHQEG